jgi:hypothetical protein
MKKLVLSLSLVLCIIVLMYYCDNTTGINDDDIIIMTATITPTIINNPTPTIEPTVIPTVIPTVNPPTPDTTYQVKNSSSSLLEMLSCYYWNGSATEDMIIFGDLSINNITPKTSTDHNKIDIAFYLGTHLCIVTDNFYITNYTNNIFTITGSTHVSCD